MDSSKDTSSVVSPGVHPGFPSPSQDYLVPCIDLNKELVLHPAATFYGRVVTDAMSSEGVDKGDVLVIDRALEPKSGDLAVCFVDGEFALRRISKEYEEYQTIVIWGVVSYVIKNVHRK